MRAIYPCHDVSLPKIFRTAIFLTGFSVIAACASTSTPSKFGGYAYLTPGPTSEPVFLGVFETEPDCHDAGEAWASQQVVGNPVFYECLPVDKR